MKQVIALSSFNRSVKKLNLLEKAQLVESLEQFKAFVFRGIMSAGLGFKKINHDKYEFRVNIRLRVIVKVEGEDYYLVLAGNHDEVKRYLRHYR